MIIFKFYTYIRNLDLYQLLPNSFLPTNDIAGMKNGVEIRSPYLNLKLLNFINQFDPSFILTNQKKIFLKTMLKKYLPDELINKKMGFNFFDKFN